MGRVGCLVLIVVLIIIGYDQWRIEQLRKEVRAISGKVHASRDRTKSDLVTSLAGAERHARAARELIEKKKSKEAIAELDKALKSLRSANRVSEDIVGDVAESLGSARDKAVRVFHKAWKDISEEAKSGKNPGK